MLAIGRWRVNRWRRPRKSSLMQVGSSFTEHHALSCNIFKKARVASPDVPESRDTNSRIFRYHISHGSILRLDNSLHAPLTDQDPSTQRKFRSSMHTKTTWWQKGPDLCTYSAWDFFSPLPLFFQKRLDL